MPIQHSSSILTLTPSEIHNIIVDLSLTNGLIAIEGKKAFEFLQGQLTCDVNEISSHQSRLGAHCNPKGRIQSTFRLFKLQDCYYLYLPQEMIPHAVQTLKKYALFFKITPIDVSNSFKIIGLSGPSIDAVLKELEIPIPQQIDEVCSFENNLIIRVPTTTLPLPSEENISTQQQRANPDYSQQQNQSHEQLFDPTVLSYLSRYILVGKSDDLQPLFARLNQLPQLISAKGSDWKKFDIAAGLATIYPQTAGEFTPHHINYPALHAVSFKKGCYTGQEIVARMQYLGTLKQHLVRGMCNTTTPLEAGTKLYNETSDEVGAIIDSAPYSSNPDQQLLLAVIANNAIDKSIHIGSSEASEFIIL